MSWAEDMGFGRYDKEDILRLKYIVLPKKWTTKDGTSLKWQNMSYSHIENTLKMLRRENPNKPFYVKNSIMKVLIIKNLDHLIDS